MSSPHTHAVYQFVHELGRASSQAQQLKRNKFKLLPLLSKYSLEPFSAVFFPHCHKWDSFKKMLESQNYNGEPGHNVTIFHSSEQIVTLWEHG